jgi:DNA polymerase III alpha subunit
MKPYASRIVKRRSRWAWLHTHSTASDGLDTPLALAQMARVLHVQHLSLTDHDTLDGYDVLRPLRHELHNQGVHVWAGVEMTIEDFGKHGHLTVLFPDSSQLSSYDALAALLAKPRAQRTIEALASIPCLILSGCKGSVLYRYGETYSGKVEVLSRWRNLLGDRLYIEVQPYFARRFEQILYASLAQDTGLPLVITADSHSRPDLPLIDELKIRDYSPAMMWQDAVSRTEAIVNRLRAWETSSPPQLEPISPGARVLIPVHCE